MKKNILKVHPADNVIVALRNLVKGEQAGLDGEKYILQENISAKHKFTERDFDAGDSYYNVWCIGRKSSKQYSCRNKDINCLLI